MANTLNLTARIELLKAIHNFVITEFSDEDNILCWFRNGLPENPKEEDFEYNANEGFAVCLEWFFFVAEREDMTMLDVYIGVFKRFF